MLVWKQKRAKKNNKYIKKKKPFKRAYTAGRRSTTEFPVFFFFIYIIGQKKIINKKCGWNQRVKSTKIRSGLSLSRLPLHFLQNRKNVLRAKKQIQKKKRKHTTHRQTLSDLSLLSLSSPNKKKKIFTFAYRKAKKKRKIRTTTFNFKKW